MTDVAAPKSVSRNESHHLPLWCALGLGLILAVTTGLVVGPVAQAAEIAVADGQSVADAVDQASSGDVIVVAGKRTESRTINIDKDITLQAAAGGAEIASDAEIAIRQTAGTLTLGGDGDDPVLSIVQQFRRSNATAIGVEITRGTFEMRPGMSVTFSHQASDRQVGLQLKAPAVANPDDLASYPITAEISGGTCRNRNSG